MENLIFKLEVLAKVKEAISIIYCDVADSNTYHDCMEVVNDIESKMIQELKNIKIKDELPFKWKTLYYLKNMI